MHIYIVGNDGITLCREAPAAMNEGEIVVASNEELHAGRHQPDVAALKSTALTAHSLFWPFPMYEFILAVVSPSL